MNLERRIRKLNHLLVTELGTSPEFAWLAANSAEMMHPCQVLDSEGEPIYDVLCQCGKNIAVHSPYCKISASVVRGEIQPRLPKYMGWWVLAGKRPVQDWEAEELRRASRPAVLWEPVAVEQHPLGYALWPHEPDERLTRGVIQMIREFRSLTPAEHGRAFREAYRKQQAAKKARAYAMARERFGLTVNPWKKGGVSLPTPQKLRHQGAIQ